MKVLIKHIAYLLPRRRKLYVDGLGTFYMHTTGARIDESLGLVHPPFTSIKLYPNASGKDCFMIDSYMRKYECSEKAASMMIKKGVDKLVLELNKKGFVSLGEIGTLHNRQNPELRYKNGRFQSRNFKTNNFPCLQF